MRAIKEHTALLGPRFICRDVDKTTELVVELNNSLGSPATAEALAHLKRLAGSAYSILLPLYEQYDGVVFHEHAGIAGLVVATISELHEFNAEWRDWFEGVSDDELYDYQRDGFAFATIEGSGNYFVVSRGRIYYSDHDGGDDTPWADDLEGFFARALGDPAQFLDEVGCYTRYSDGVTDKQFIPVRFEHG